MMRRQAGFALALVVVACASGADGVADDLSGRVGAERVSTTESGVRLLSGYTSLFDTQKRSCVKTVENRAPLVGQLSAETTIKQVRSDTELAKELGIDFALSIKAPTASLKVTANFVDSFKNSTTTLNYLIESTQSYVVSQNGDVELDATALADLRDRPESFTTKCGDRFVSSVTFQASVYALVSYRTTSVERATSLQASIGGRAGVGVRVDASVKTRLSNASKQSDVETTVRAITSGFALNSRDPLLGVSGDIDAKLKRIDEVGGMVARSLGSDRARDTQDYANNNSRSSVPVAVSLANYSIAVNAPPGASATFAKHQETLRKTETFIRRLSEVQHRMNRAYLDEISPFLAEQPEAKAAYNLLPPAPPKRFSSELVPIADQWARRFRPDDGTSVGSDVEPVAAAIARCVDAAKDGNFSSCGQASDASALREYKGAVAALDAYAATGRIGKMRFYVLDNAKPLARTWARWRCEDNNGFSDRLPSADEAARLAPIIAGAGGGTKKTIWIAETPSCRLDDDKGATYTNPLEPAQGPSTGCLDVSLFGGPSQPTICVPQSGPIGPRSSL